MDPNLTLEELLITMRHCVVWLSSRHLSSKETSISTHLQKLPVYCYKPRAESVTSGGCSSSVLETLLKTCVGLRVTLRPLQLLLAPHVQPSPSSCTVSKSTTTIQNPEAVYLNAFLNFQHMHVSCYFIKDLDFFLVT